MVYCQIMFFWHEVVEKYQEVNEEFDMLRFQHTMFQGVDPSIRLEQSWNKLFEIHKGLMKSCTEVHKYHKNGGNHDDFEKLCW